MAVDVFLLVLMVWLIIIDLELIFVRRSGADLLNKVRFLSALLVGLLVGGGDHVGSENFIMSELQGVVATPKRGLASLLLMLIILHNRVLLISCEEGLKWPGLAFFWFLQVVSGCCILHFYVFNIRVFTSNVRNFDRTSLIRLINLDLVIYWVYSVL